MTNDDLANMEAGLTRLRQATMRPTLSMMVTFCLNTLKPATSALRDTHLEIREQFLDLDPANPGVDPRNKDGTLKMRPDKTEADYDKEMDTLYKHEVDVTLPKFRFRLQDFMESPMTISPEIIQLLGPLVSFEGFEGFVEKLQGIPNHSP